MVEAYTAVSASRLEQRLRAEDVVREKRDGSRTRTLLCDSAAQLNSIAGTR
jgi:hypothetical protein